MDFMGYTAILAATAVVAVVAYHVLKIAWFIVSWRVLGLKQMVLDETQLHITAEECAMDYIQQWKKRDADTAEAMRFESLAPFVAWAITRYIQNWSLGARPFWKKPAELPEYEARLKARA